MAAPMPRVPPVTNATRPPTVPSPPPPGPGCCCIVVVIIACFPSVACRYLLPSCAVACSSVSRTDVLRGVVASPSWRAGGSRHEPVLLGGVEFLDLRHGCSGACRICGFDKAETDEPTAALPFLDSANPTEPTSRRRLRRYPFSSEPGGRQLAGERIDNTGESASHPWSRSRCACCGTQTGWAIDAHQFSLA